MLIPPEAKFLSLKAEFIITFQTFEHRSEGQEKKRGIGNPVP
jgi:hypothetical protein